MSVATFGEIMLRLTPYIHAEKIQSAKAFEVNFAGAESNVASSLGILKHEVSFVSKLPQNQLGEAAIRSLRSYGIDTQYILRGGKRIGSYFIEIGTSIRPSSVIYDREQSAISSIGPDEFNWNEILRGKKWLFLTGITPVLSEQCSHECLLAAKTAKEMGLKVAFDMNYRRSLWKSANDARRIFDQILAFTDLLFCNVGVLKDVYGHEASGNDSIERTWEASKWASKEFGISQIACTIRDHNSASQNRLSGLYLLDKQHFTSSDYEVRIIDRFGTGDSFVAAFLHGLIKAWNPQHIINFSTAAFALKHTIKGDQHTSSEAEINSIMEGHTSGHVLR